MTRKGVAERLDVQLSFRPLRQSSRLFLRAQDTFRAYLPDGAPAKPRKAGFPGCSINLSWVMSFERVPVGISMTRHLLKATRPGSSYHQDR